MRAMGQESPYGHGSPRGIVSQPARNPVRHGYPSRAARTHCSRSMRMTSQEMPSSSDSLHTTRSTFCGRMMYSRVTSACLMFTDTKSRSEQRGTDRIRFDDPCGLSLG